MRVKCRGEYSDLRNSNVRPEVFTFTVFYFEYPVVTVIKSRMIRLTWRLKCLENPTCEYKILVREAQMKRSSGRHITGSEDDV